MLKNVEPDSLAIAFPIIVLPVPGLNNFSYGPNNKTPLGGVANPLKRSGFYLGNIKVSKIICFAKSRPAMSSQLIF
jgi:hypothetical protein